MRQENMSMRIRRLIKEGKPNGLIAESVMLRYPNTKHTWDSLIAEIKLNRKLMSTANRDLQLERDEEADRDEHYYHNHGLHP